IKILGRFANQRTFRYVDKNYIEGPDNFNSYKIFIPKANGSGALGEVLSTPLIGQPLIGQPLIGHTQSFISIGKFKTVNEAEACLKYVKSKFARTMLGILKITQDNKKKVWKYVPLQDFTSKSDIDWTKSVHEIDLQLYEKYGLSKEEKDFIETHVKEMV
ncbi:MAG: DEAD/DEAH box helicase, partial [Treponema sp.]|nr:DEAD/DEAH box helicase [Treponema sp.]